jgi:predicted ester cyclase
MTEQNKALVLQFYEAFDDRKIDQALALLSPSFVAHLAGVSEPLNGEEFKQFGMSFYSAFSHGQHVFDQAIVSGDYVVTCGTFTAKHLGTFQGLPPTGKKISLSIMHIDPGLFHSKERFEKVNALSRPALSLGHIIKIMVTI